MTYVDKIRFDTEMRQFNGDNVSGDQESSKPFSSKGSKNVTFLKRAPMKRAKRLNENGKSVGKIMKTGSRSAYMKFCSENRASAVDNEGYKFAVKDTAKNLADLMALL